MAFQFPETALITAINAVRDLRSQLTSPRMVIKIYNQWAQFIFNYRSLSRGVDVRRLPRPLPFTTNTWSADVPIYGESLASVTALTEEVLQTLKAAGFTPQPREPPHAVTADELDPHLGREIGEGGWACYWRSPPPFPPEMEPERDQRGVIFFAPVVPLDGSDVSRVAREFQRAALRKGFDPAVTVNVIDSRAACLVCALYYARSEALADARAQACLEEIHAKLEKRGVWPYRLGTLNMSLAPRKVRAVRQVESALKKIFDPEGVIAPGRYIRGTNK